MAEAQAERPSFTRAAMAAGALFVDDEDRMMLVRSVYKSYWDIPGGYVEPGESPQDACRREVAEELGIRPQIGQLLVIDWAPHPSDGDKLLFIFDGGRLTEYEHKAISLQPAELAEYRYVEADELQGLTIPRLAKRVRAALEARRHGQSAYLEHGVRQI